jgi:hypothetical protein
MEKRGGREGWKNDWNGKWHIQWKHMKWKGENGGGRLLLLLETEFQTMNVWNLG